MDKPIKAFVFDVYGTLFDVIAIKEQCEELFPGHGEAISQTWRTKQVEYFMMRQLMEKYISFAEVTRSALKYALESEGLESTEAIERQLMDAYLHLPLYEESEAVLRELQNHKLVVFSNGSHDMLDPLIENAGIQGLLDEALSVDDIGQFKPAPAAYQYALSRLGIERDEVLFMSSNGWDISGAKNFGFRTAWINRKQAPVEQLGLEPNYVFSDLKGLLKWK
ncbi:haloacid dehalogenase, type II [Planococcus plakortidis]|uniref:Haloacid dehalogenase, type II n=1 Tax=Planococcus plakortidis TaxID=1038856 RepID=A0A1C7E8B4_9BACL|nr:haloacid dehalogenase type II [Planococcus plakortidis]ANU20100.1 haloacid dehalogenase, type II [Planococcus plakortidis]